MTNFTITALPYLTPAGTLRLDYQGGHYELPYTGPRPLNYNDLAAKIDKLLAAQQPVPVPSMPVPTPPIKPAGASFFDGFERDDPARWVQFDGTHWPPVAGSPGTWARCFYYGWPSNSGGSDPAARTLRANKEAQCYEDRAVSVGPDGLTLTAIRDSGNHHGLPWTSGCIVQHRDTAQLYGRFEMVAKLPRGRGFWPAFWLLAADMSWPPEIDIMEKVGLNENNGPTDNIYRAGVVQATGFWKTATGLDQWHTYGCTWTRDTITFTFDGEVIGQEPTPANMQKPMYLLANLAVGGAGSWPGEPDPSATSASMIIRSITAYPL